MQSCFVKEQRDEMVACYNMSTSLLYAGLIDSDDNWPDEQLARWGNQHGSQVRLPSFCLLLVPR